MNLPRLYRWSLVIMLGFAVIVTAGLTSVGIRSALPGSDLNLLRHSYAWRGNSPSMANIFPDGMSGNDALHILTRIGFTCTPPKTGEPTRVSCARGAGAFPCGGKFVIELFLDHAGTIIDRNAESNVVCL